MNHIDVMKQALEALLDHYCALVNSGDAGNWNPETEDVVIRARAAIAAAEKVEPWGWVLPADRDYAIRQVSRIEPSPSGIATPLYTAPPADVVRDAERYRWLRNTDRIGHDLRTSCAPFADPQHLDAAIDKAMKEQPK